MQHIPQNYFVQSPDWSHYYQKEAEKRQLKSIGNKSGIGQIILLLIFNVVSTFLFLFILFSGGITYDYNGTVLSYDAPMYFALSGIVSILGMFISGVILARLYGLRLDDLITFKKTTGIKRIAALLPAGLAVAMLANYMVEYMLKNLGAVGVHYDLENINNYISLDNSLTTTVIYLLAISVVPAFVEEFMFRGVLMGALRKYGDGFAILTSAVLFGLMHGNLVQIPFAFIGGLAFGFIVVYSGSIIPAMLLHFLNNLFASLGDIINQQFGDTAVNMYYMVFMGLFLILGLLGIALLSKKDKTLFTFKKVSSFLTLKEKLKVFFLTPGMMIANILIVLEVAMTWTLV